MPHHQQLRLNHHRTESTTNTPKKPILQNFVDENGKKLDSLPTHDSETNIRYVLWSDIQDRFLHLRYIAAGSNHWRVFFLLAEDHQMYV